MGRKRRYALPGTVSADTPPPPSLTEAERAVWREWIPVLAEAALAAPADLLAFSEWCKARARRDAIEREMAGRYWGTTDGGSLKGHPGAALLLRIEARLDRLAARLGLDTIGRLAASLRKRQLDEQPQLPIPDPVPRQRALGKKEEALQAAHTAGDQSAWGDDLRFPGTRPH